MADAVCFAVLRLRVSTSVTASRCRLPRQRKVQKITSLCKGGAEHSEAEGETNESGASEHQLHQQHIYNCAAGDCKQHIAFPYVQQHDDGAGDEFRKAV